MKTTLVSPNERLDKEDLDNITAFSKESFNLQNKIISLDSYSRILKNFRIELPDQTLYPGRVTIHAGAGLDINGQLLYNETQLDVSRTITLEGASTTFYLEIMVVEADAVLDARGFWDPTVDQGNDPSGDPKPDGQEFSQSVATRRVMDWKVVRPVRTDMFSRDNDPTSAYIPLVKLVTDGSNQILVAVNPALVIEHAATTLLADALVGLAQIKVQDSTNLPDAGGTLIVGEGMGTVETVTVTLNNRITNIITHTALVGDHYAGEIIRAAAGSSDFITESKYPIYAKINESNPIDYRDRFFQGDEVHGDLLGKGHASVTDRSDVNLESMKDYVDYLASQIEEIKWGHTNPWTVGTSTSRIPPGLAAALPAVPRYYNPAGGLQGTRTAAITVGDGVNSWGDLNGATQDVLQAAHDALPATGGRIFIKRGEYTLTTDFDWTNPGSVVIDGEEGSVINLAGGSVHIATTGFVSIRNIYILGVSSYIGILVDTANPTGWNMENVYMTDAAFNLNAALPTTSSFRRNFFYGQAAGMSAIPLFKVSGTNGVISGTFSECDFNHATMVSVSCSLVDCVNAAPTHAMRGATFVDCSFTSDLVNFESINLGYTSDMVQFDRCYFQSQLTLCHVRAFGGSNIKFTNCFGMDAIATLFQGTDVTHVEVAGYLNNNSVGLPAVELINCNKARVKNCDVIVNSSSSVTGCAIKVIVTSGEVDDILIENNTIKGDITGGLNLSTGIIFQHNGGAGTILSNIRIKNNYCEGVETGIYFANPGVAGIYRDVTIQGNQFADNNGGFGLASNFKLGILFGSTSTHLNVTIQGNQFDNINPWTIDTVAGNSRAAIRILGSSNSNINILGNSINDVGNVVLPISETAGIYITTMTGGSIIGNTIRNIIGAAAWGIRVTGLLSRCTISGNNINYVSTTVSGGALQDYCFGICIEDMEDTAISGNQFSEIKTTVASFAAAIGIVGASSNWTNVSISGNNMRSTDDATSFIYFEGLYFIRVSTTGNTLQGTSYMFMDVVTKTGGSCHAAVISNNSANGMTVCGINVDANSSTIKHHLVISGNSIFSTNGTSTIHINGITGLSVNGNTIASDSIAHNLLCENCVKTLVTNNYFMTVDSAYDSYNIHMGSAGNVVYQISDNICDRSGTLGSTIVTAGSGNTSAGQGLVCDNVIKSICTLNPFDCGAYTYSILSHNCDLFF